LQPLLAVNAISAQQHADAAGRAVAKVLSAHSSDADASFLAREALHIRGLVDQYVRLVRKQRL